jgi:hypothetical protein
VALARTLLKIHVSKCYSSLNTYYVPVVFSCYLTHYYLVRGRIVSFFPDVETEIHKDSMILVESFHMKLLHKLSILQERISVDTLIYHSITHTILVLEI